MSSALSLPSFILDYLGMENRQETYVEGRYILDPCYNTCLGACFPCASLHPTASRRTGY
ncbi:MAG: hypothetical protein ACREEV_12555 [Dongiaceae bacterium]